LFIYMLNDVGFALYNETSMADSEENCHCMDGCTKDPADPSSCKPEKEAADEAKGGDADAPAALSEHRRRRLRGLAATQKAANELLPEAVLVPMDPWGVSKASEIDAEAVEETKQVPCITPTHSTPSPSHSPSHSH
jgi:hypothetical protein